MNWNMVRIFGLGVIVALLVQYGPVVWKDYQFLHRARIAYEGTK